MIKFVFAVLVVSLAGVAVTRAQQSSSPTLSDAEKAGIAEAVLVELESGSQHVFFVSGRTVSSYNIESLQPSQLSKHGFRLASARSLDEAKKANMVQYLVFKKIILRNGVAVIYLSSVDEGRPCFANYAFRENTSIYEARLTPAGWVAEFKREQMPFPLKRALTR